MVNEGAKILEEKIAIRASDIDVIWVHGYGWPVPGRPMFWADFDQGLTALRDRLLEYGKTVGGQRWKPAALLSQLADQGKTFTGYRPTMTYEGLYGPARIGYICPARTSSGHGVEVHKEARRSSAPASNALSLIDPGGRGPSSTRRPTRSCHAATTEHRRDVR